MADMRIDAESQLSPPDKLTIDVNEAGELYAKPAVGGVDGHAGIVKPDGTTTTVTEDGTISAVQSSYSLPIATENTLGGVMVDGDTISVDEDGVISAAGSYRSKINLSAQCDGSKLVFTGDFLNPSMAMVYLNGLKLCEGVNYTITDSALTMTTAAPKTSSVLEVELF
jgi:flagellar basal body rod protein FlgF